MLLQELYGLADDVAAAARTGRRPAGFDAHHAVVAAIDEVPTRNSSEWKFTDPGRRSPSERAILSA